MNKTLITVGIIAAVGILIGGMYFTYSNAEIRQRSLVNAKQKDNQSELDNTIKTIAQSAQVTDAQTKALKEIIIGNATARKSGSGSLATMVQEAVPNLDQSTKTFQNLQNQIVAARNSWTMQQKELIDLQREHHNMLTIFPSSLFVGSRPEIQIIIVTSDRTEESFRTGKDNDINVFGK